MKREGGMTTKWHHISPDSRGSWKVKKEGAERASRVFDKKEDAIRHGREMSKSHGIDLYVHRRDGTVESKASYRSEELSPSGRAKNK
jgi:hypothetical protein